MLFRARSSRRSFIRQGNKGKGMPQLLHGLLKPEEVFELRHDSCGYMLAPSKWHGFGCHPRGALAVEF